MPVIINGTTGITFPNGVTMSDGTSAPVTVAQGGTGETTRQAAIDALAGAVTSGQYLRGNGTDVVMSAIQTADVPTLNQNTTGTAGNVTGTVAIANGGTGQTTATTAFNALNPMTTTGDILYEVSPTTAARLPIGTTGQVLTVSGGIPAWAAAPSPVPPDGSITDPKIADGVVSGGNYIAFGSTTSRVPSNTGYIEYLRAFSFRGGVMNFRATVNNGNIGNENSTTITGQIFVNGSGTGITASVSIGTNQQGTFTISNVTIPSNATVSFYLANNQGNANAVAILTSSYGVGSPTKIAPLSGAVQIG